MSISYVRNNLGVIKNIINLIKNNNALAGQILKHYILKYVLESKSTRLVRLFYMQFIERHDAINVLIYLFKSIIINLKNIQEITRSGSSNTFSHLSGVERGKSSFIISLLNFEHHV